jgi:hypothetical protein
MYSNRVTETLLRTSYALRVELGRGTDQGSAHARGALVKETEQGGSQASEGGCLREPEREEVDESRPEGLEDVLGDDGVVDAGDFSSWSGSSCRWSAPAASPPPRRALAPSSAGAWRGAAGSTASDGEEKDSEGRRLGLGAGEMRGEEGDRSAGRNVMWLSVNYAWRIMRNMRHAYLTLSQIPQRLSV